MEKIIFFVTLIIVIGATLFVTGLRLSWRAADEKTARKQADINARQAGLQRQADQAGADSLNNDTDLEQELNNGKF